MNPWRNASYLLSVFVTMWELRKAKIVGIKQTRHFRFDKNDDIIGINASSLVNVPKLRIKLSSNSEPRQRRLFCLTSLIKKKFKKRHAH